MAIVELVVKADPAKGASSKGATFDLMTDVGEKVAGFPELGMALEPDGVRVVSLDIVPGAYIVILNDIPAGTTATSTTQAFVVDTTTTKVERTFALSKAADADTVAPDEDGAVENWLTRELSIAVLGAVGFWVLMTVLPGDDKGAFGGIARWTIFGIGAAVVLAALYLATLWKTKSPTAERPTMTSRLRYAVPLGVAGVALILMSRLMDDLDTEVRFALTVGGTAVAGLVIGLTRFTSVRAAASVAIVVLFIGLATFPGATETMTEDVVQSLITWMAVILGVNAAGETAKQVAQSVGEAKVASVRAATGESVPAGTPALREPAGDLPPKRT